jgi:hypothetical protein
MPKGPTLVGLTALVIGGVCDVCGSRDFGKTGKQIPQSPKRRSLNLTSRGHVFVSGPRHVLIWSTDPKGDTGYQDYLAAFH